MLSQSLLHIRVFGDQHLYLTLKDLQLPQDNLITITKEFVIELVGVQFLAHAFLPSSLPLSGIISPVHSASGSYSQSQPYVPSLYTLDWFELMYLKCNYSSRKISHQTSVYWLILNFKWRLRSDQRKNLMGHIWNYMSITSH